MPNERRSRILDAACRVIARDGAERLRVSDVAAEAGVSTALVHYYYSTRADVIREAFLHVDTRADAATAAAVLTEPNGHARLTRLIAAWTSSDEAFRLDWAVWSEMWRFAAFDEAARSAVVAGFSAWVGQFESLLAEGIADGSVAPDVDPYPAAMRLAAQFEGFGQQVAIGMLGWDELRELMLGALANETGRPVSLEETR